MMMIVVADFKKHVSHFSDSIIGLSFSSLKMTQFNDFKVLNIGCSNTLTKILIVEDNEVNQQFVKNQLVSLGFDVELK